MSIQVVCAKCGTSFQTATANAGRRTRCQSCGEVLTVPSSPSAVKPAATSRPEPRAAEATHEPMLQLPPQKPHPDDLIDMTAMVDIVFFLLIFFLVTSMQSLESVMDISAPEVEDAAAQAHAVSSVASDEETVIIRIEEDDSMWLDDEQVYSEQDLRIRLREIRRENSDLESVRVLGHADASHGAAVKAMDCCTGAGFAKLSFAVQEDLEE